MSQFSPVNEWKIKEMICEIGRRVYQKGFAAANDGNISFRVGENEVLCTPSLVSKGYMKPEEICKVDLEGKQLAGTKKRTSEILLHLTIMKNRPDVRAVVHCHPPHATAFAVAQEPIPKCVLPEVEVFLGETPIVRYETPGTQTFADTVLPFIKDTSTLILANHGTVSCGRDLEDAFFKTEILDAYCRILILAHQLGSVNFLSQKQTAELLEFKKRLNIPDPRIGMENCDLCSNSVFREGYKEHEPQPRIFAYRPPAGAAQPQGGPECQCKSHAATSTNGHAASSSKNGTAATIEDADLEAIVRQITERVVEALGVTQ